MGKITYLIIIVGVVIPISIQASQRINFINKYDVSVCIVQQYKNDSKNERENEHEYLVVPNGSVELVVAHKSPGSVYGQINNNYVLRFYWLERLPSTLEFGAENQFLSRSMKEMKGARRVIIGPDVACAKGGYMPSIHIEKIK